MPVKKGKTSKKGGVRGRSRVQSKAKAKKRTPDASASFAEDLIRRGEAAHLSKDGRLPPGATHEIIDDRPGKPPTVVRRRFTIV